MLDAADDTALEEEGARLWATEEDTALYL